MTAVYLKSATGSDSNDGSSWAAAKATLSAALTAAASGGTIWASSSHSESSAALPYSLNFSGSTPSLVTKLVGVSDAATPPTAPAQGAAITSKYFTISGVVAYIEGVTFNMASTTGSVTSTLGAITQRFVNTNFTFDSTASNGQGPITIDSTDTEFWGCNFTFANANAGFGTLIQSSNITFYGGAISTQAGVTLTGLFVNLQVANVVLDGVDLSNCAMGYIGYWLLKNAQLTLRNCKYRSADAAISADSTCFGNGSRNEVTIINCDKNTVASTYRFEKVNMYGKLVATTAIYRQSGATVNAFNVSWGITSYSAGWPFGFVVPAITKYQDGVGSSMVASVEILAPVGMTNRDVWLEVRYDGDTGTVMSTLSSAQGSFVSAPVALTASSATWTGKPANMTAYTLSVSVNPKQAGLLTAQVRLGSKQNIYVDPFVTVA